MLLAWPKARQGMARARRLAARPSEGVVAGVDTAVTMSTIFECSQKDNMSMSFHVATADPHAGPQLAHS
jgi:hypothetical protein